MLAILGVTFPFFALVGLGLVAARSRLLPLAAVPGLNVFVLYFALTALLFQFGAKTPVAELLDPVVLGTWLLAGLVVVGLAVVVARRRGTGWLDSSFGALIAVLPNSGFMGLPLLIALLGAQAAGPLIASLLIDVAVMQSLGVALAHLGQGGDRGLWREVRESATRVARNPLPWAIIIGALWGLTGLTMPKPIDQTLEILGQAATPAALFTIGAVLAREQMEAAPGTSRVGDVPWLSVLKLFVHPALIYGIGLAAIALGLPLPHLALVTLTLTAALPSAANVSVLAERFRADNGRVAKVILVTTTVSFLTFSGAVALLT